MANKEWYPRIRDARESQAGRCNLCGRHSMLYIDHDHELDDFRALLCPSCNTGMGLLGDDPALLRRAADYVEYHRKRILTGRS